MSSLLLLLLLLSVMSSLLLNTASVLLVTLAVLGVFYLFFCGWVLLFPVGRTCTGGIRGCRSESVGAGMASCVGQQEV